MKKALTFVVALAMLLSLCVVGTFAEGENKFVLTRVADPKACELIDVEIAVQTAGLVALAGQINFDKNAVEFVSFTAAKDFTTVVGPQSADAANEMGAVAFSADASTAEDNLSGLVKIGTAVFKLKAEGAVEVPFSGKADSACDKDLNDVAIDELAETGISTASIHEYADATCTAPKTCVKCGATSGEANGHDFADATCTAPKTCKVCGATEGEAAAHDFKDGKCTVCGAADPNYVAPKPEDQKPAEDQKPVDNQKPAEKPADKPVDADKKNPNTSAADVFAFAGLASVLAAAAVVAKKKF